MARAWALALLVACGSARGAEIELCSGPLCFSFGAADAYAPSILTYGEASISGTGSADGFVLRLPIDGAPTNFGAEHGGDFPRWERYEPDALFARLTTIGPAEDATAVWLAQGVQPIDGGFAMKQFVQPGPLAGDVDQVYGFLMNFDSRFTDWRAYNSTGGLVQAIIADPDLAQQRLGGTQDVRTVVAYDYERGLQLIVENNFEPLLDPFWFLIAEGVGREHGNKLYAQLNGVLGSDEFYRADWTIRVAPFTAAVPEPSGWWLAALAWLVLMATCKRP